MEHTKLSKYKRKNGVLISPWNEFVTPLAKDLSWLTGRVPEYLWIALLLNSGERRVTITKCLVTMKTLYDICPTLPVPAWSQILRASKVQQERLFSFIINTFGDTVLCPLTAITSFTDSPPFVTMFHSSSPLPEKLKTITATLKEISDHQTNKSTDIRYVVFYFCVITGKYVLPQEYLKMLDQYRLCSHEDEEMHMLRPFIRSSEVAILSIDKLDNSSYLDRFWKIISESTDCECFYIKYKEEEVNVEILDHQLHNVFVYYQELLKTQPLNNKFLVLLGIATYSYKRFKELVTHSLYYEISGRSISRSLIENYIMMKYLLKQENAHSDIWTEFQYYGIGKYKLVVQKMRETGKTDEKNQLNFTYLECLIGEYTNEEFLNMDLRYFDNVGIRDKAIDVGEKELYDLLYDYESQFEHGLWGAIRESALLKCDNPAHQFHCVPDIEDVQKLPSVLEDCKTVMLKTIMLLKNEFGLPAHLEFEGIK